MVKPPGWDVGTVCLMTDHLQSPEKSLCHAFLTNNKEETHSRGGGRFVAH